MLSEAIIVVLIGAAVSLLTSSLTSKVQWDKFRTGEKPLATANTAASLTDTSIELVNEIRKERAEDKEKFNAAIETQDRRISLLEQENSDLRQQLSEMEDVREWAERLVHQLKAHGIEPVKIRARNSRPGQSAE